MNQAGDVIPASAAALRVGLSRERVIRCVQRGRVDGGQVAGRWVVSVRGLKELSQMAEAERAPATAGGGR